MDENLIPTGVIAPVSGTALDFRTAHVVGERINGDDPQIKIGGGY